MLYIADQAFPFARTAFLAYLSIGPAGWRVSWSLEFQGIEREIEELDWRPKVISHCLEVTLPPLSELPGYEVELAPSPNGEPPFIVSVFEHEPLLEGRLQFGAWNGEKIQFLLVGTTDVLADEKYDTQLPVRIECELPFDGVVVDEGDLAKAEEKFARFFERCRFAGPERHENGGFLFKLRAKTATEETVLR